MSAYVALAAALKEHHANDANIIVADVRERRADVVSLQGGLYALSVEPNGFARLTPPARNGREYFQEQVSVVCEVAPNADDYEGTFAALHQFMLEEAAWIAYANPAGLLSATPAQCEYSVAEAGKGLSNSVIRAELSVNAEASIIAGEFTRGGLYAPYSPFGDNNTRPTAVIATTDYNGSTETDRRDLPAPQGG